MGGWVYYLQAALKCLFGQLNERRDVPGIDVVHALQGHLHLLLETISDGSKQTRGAGIGPRIGQESVHQGNIFTGHTETKEGVLDELHVWGLVFRLPVFIPEAIEEGETQLAACFYLKVSG